MEYDIGLIFDKKHYANITTDPDLKELLKKADTKKQKEDCMLFYWEKVTMDDRIQKLQDFIYDEFDCSCPEDFRYITIDSDGCDCDDVGDWYDNPFSFGVAKKIVFNGADDKKIAKIDLATLRIYNNKSGVTNCHNCNGILKDPMPGCPSLKHCPKCEP